ncbi:uncharacterized protein [Malus domestica]|uniref:uncharacterized protein isoform X2 n=1 Tax=Malus domestica TaxID=3750 RepID=UPI00049906BB|nr:uncharacterized protein LOC103443926 isoform X2 [Malus domestica]
MSSPADDGQDGWVKLAMNDEAAVVDLLLRLKHAAPPSPSKRSSTHGFPTLRWSVRQRRSRNVPRNHHADDVAAEGRKSKKGESSGARASPTTPLSWNGATSVSGGGGCVDGSEESSKPLKPTDTARSKVAVRSELTIFKRPRKKKELAVLRLTVEKQRATNESLKKVKLELQLPQTKMKATTLVLSGEAIWQQNEQINAVGYTTPIMTTSAHCNNAGTSQSSCPSNVSSKGQQEVGSRDTAFSLPDLNLPFGEDSSSEVLY